jgi:hypothetical protein
MTPAAIIRLALEDGLTLAVTQSGGIKARGKRASISRWLPVIRERKPDIIVALQAANDAERPNKSVEFFSFTPPGKHTNDDDMLPKRVAVMLGSGMNEATALQEARWNADRERCWRGFLRNAQNILDAPSAQREELLAVYETEANRHYGHPTTSYMADSLRAWVTIKLQ